MALNEQKMREIIREELRTFFAKTVGLIPIENDNRKKNGIKELKNKKSKGLIHPDKDKRKEKDIIKPDKSKKE